MRGTLLALLLAAASALAGAPRIVYTKSFPGSMPAYVWISVEKDGSATYKEADDDPNPVKLQLDARDAAAIFDLADKLEHFEQPLESGLKVANMGIKTFRWEDGSEKREVKFNYSLDENARLLQDWFEKITETEQRFFTLERAVKYDKLGVNDALLQLHILWDQKRVVAPQQFLPLLDRVAKNDSYLHMARERAALLADAFRNNKQKSE